MTEKRKAYMRAYARRRKENGLCKWCGLPAENGRTLCAYCNKVNNLRRRKAA